VNGLLPFGLERVWRSCNPVIFPFGQSYASPGRFVLLGVANGASEACFLVYRRFPPNLNPLFRSTCPPPTLVPSFDFYSVSLNYLPAEGAAPLGKSPVMCSEKNILLLPPQDCLRAPQRQSCYNRPLLRIKSKTLETRIPLLVYLI